MFIYITEITENIFNRIHEGKISFLVDVSVLPQSRVSLTKINIGAVKRIIFIFNNKLDFKKICPASAEKHHHSLTILSVQAGHVVGHTRRSRGSQPGREKRRDGIFYAPENRFHGTLGSQRMGVGTMTQQLIFAPPTTSPPGQF